MVQLHVSIEVEELILLEEKIGKWDLDWERSEKWKEALGWHSTPYYQSLVYAYHQTTSRFAFPFPGLESTQS